MNQTKNLPIKMGQLYGAALGLTVVSIGIIRYKTGMILRGDQRLSYLYWTIFTLTIFFAVFRFKKQNPSSFSFKQSFKIGLFAGLVSGAMYTIYIVILNNYIDPELPAKIQAFISNAEETSEDASGSMGVMKMSSALRGAVYTLVCMFFGIVHSFIATFVVKRLK